MSELTGGSKLGGDSVGWPSAGLAMAGWLGPLMQGRARLLVEGTVLSNVSDTLESNAERPNGLRGQGVGGRPWDLIVWLTGCLDCLICLGCLRLAGRS